MFGFQIAVLLSKGELMGIQMVPPAPGHWPAKQSGTDAHSRNIEPAPVVDVMFDQLEYLVAHASCQCPVNCLDCDRLERIKGLLLVPFRTVGSW